MKKGLLAGLLSLLIVFLNYEKIFAQSFASLTNGVVADGSTLNSSMSQIALTGFSVTTTTNTSFTKFVIQTNFAVNTYLANIKLVRNNNGSYPSSPQPVGTVNIVSGTNIEITFSSGEAVNNTTKNYFLVADISYAGSSINYSAQVIINSGSFAFTATNNYPAYLGQRQYRIDPPPPPTLSFASNSTGYSTGSTLYYNQSGIVLHAVTLTPSGSAYTVQNAVVNYNTNTSNPISTYFGTLELWGSTTGSYANAVKLADCGQSGSVITASIGNFTLTSGVSYTFYLVGTLSNGASSMPSTFSLDFTKIYSDNPSISFTNAATSKSYSLSIGTLTIADNNQFSSGITNNPNIAYGQTDIVLFSFSTTIQGKMTISSMRIPSNISMSGYFPTAKLYRSTDPYFRNAIEVPGATADFNAGYTGAVISNINQTITSYSSTVTYYYFLVADLTASIYYSTPATLTYSMATTQNPAAVTISTSNTFNPSTNITGKNFTIVSNYDWVGFSNSFTDKHNFNVFNSGADVSTLPNSSIAVFFGRKSYTTSPSIPTGTSLASINFSSDAISTPTITLQAGTITLNSLNVLPNVNAVINGPASGTATITLPATSYSVIASTGSLTLGNNVTINIATGGTFVLKSDAKGSASIGTMPASSTITGTVNVERYVQGSSSDLTKRGYRLMSSPVNAGTVTSSPFTAKVYDLNFLKTYSIVTGLNGNTNGFTSPGNASIYLFRQDILPSNTSFASGNFKGIAQLNNSIAYKFGINKKNTLTNLADTTTFLPIGNGFLFFFRGNSNTSNGTTGGSKTTLAYNYPENTTLVQTGTLNTGSITVQPWMATSTNTNLSYTGTIANSSIRGYNLVGNPYPCTINWEKYNRNGASSSIYGTNGLGSTIYIYNSTSKQYQPYQIKTSNLSFPADTTTNINPGTSADGVVSNMIASGQGFFIVATVNNQSLTFREAAKVTTQPTPTNVVKIMSAPGTNTISQANASNNINVAPVPSKNIEALLRVKMIMDSINSDAFTVVLNKANDDRFSEIEDAIDFGGNGALVSLTAYSKDTIGLSINRLSLPKKNSPKIIPILADATTTGLYSLKVDELRDLPNIYKVWLKDNFKKDSLDLRANNNYNFNINKADQASYGKRFQIIITSDFRYRFLNFTGQKTSNNVELKWKTEFEDDYLTFTVERSVDGGKTYTALSTIISNGAGNYTFTDKALIKGTYIYRIKQEDSVNDETKYSDPQTLTFEDIQSVVNNSSVVIYPNPTTGTVSFIVNNISTTSNNKYSIKIVNSTGSLVKQLSSSQSVWSGNVSDLLPGIYFVEVTDNNQFVGRSKFTKL